MKLKNLKMLLAVVLCLVIVFYSGYGATAYAYVYNGWELSNPSNVKYKIGSSAAQYTSSIMTYSEIWESYCDEVNISYVSSDENIYFYGNISVDNDTYATTYHNSNDYHAITFYKDFLNTTTVEKNEIIVHEVGHALGLAHCQAANNGISVMRALGFNNKPYPLSDDINGISNLY